MTSDSWRLANLCSQVADWVSVVDSRWETGENRNSSVRFSSKSYGWSSNVDQSVAQNMKYWLFSVAHWQRDGWCRRKYVWLEYTFICRPTSRQSTGLGCLLKLREDRSEHQDIKHSESTRCEDCVEWSALTMGILYRHICVTDTSSTNP